jgi:hypothetical protein
MADEFDRLYTLMKDGFDGVHNRLDELNGRTRGTERAIAVLEDRGVRSPDYKARWGAGIVGAAVGAAEILRQVLGK